MKINLACPRNETCKQFECDDERLRKFNLYDYRLGQDVEGNIFSDDFKGYTFRITGGSDTEGFPMTQGVLVASRVRLLLPRGAIGFAAWRARSGERARKSVRGCIVAGDIAVLNLTVVKNGEKPIEGVTDVQNPRRLGPKRASKIRRLFDLAPNADVRQFVVRRKVEKDGKKTRVKGPRVQRLITPTIRARRAAKLATAKAAIAKGQESRREFLSLLASRRMAHRQRKISKARNQREAQFKKIAAVAANKPAAAKKVAKK